VSGRCARESTSQRALCGKQGDAGFRYQGYGYNQCQWNPDLSGREVDLTCLSLPSPERATLPITLLLNRLDTLAHTLLHAHLLRQVIREVVSRHICLDLTWVQRQNLRLTPFPLQLSRHVAECLVQGGFAGGVDGEAILFGSEMLCAAAVAGDEYEGFDGDVGAEEGLGCDDGSDGVGLEVQVECFIRTGYA